MHRLKARPTDGNSRADGKTHSRPGSADGKTHSQPGSADGKTTHSRPGSADGKMTHSQPGSSEASEAKPAAASSRVIVKGLPSYITQDKLRKHFSSLGTLTDVKLMMTPRGTPRSFGFVGFTSPAEAQKAVQKMNNSYINTSKISVEIALSYGDSGAPRAWSKYTPGTSAYLERQKIIEQLRETRRLRRQAMRAKKHAKKGLPDAAAANDEQAAKRAKTVAQQEREVEAFLDIPKRHEQKMGIWANDDDSLAYLRSRYQQQDSSAEQQPAASNAEEKSRAKQAPGDDDSGDDQQQSDSGGDRSDDDDDDDDDDKKSDSDKEEKASDEEKTANDDEIDHCRLFVRNLAFAAKENDIEDKFGSFGEVREVHIPVDRMSKKPIGVAFVQFAKPEAAALALSSMDGSIFFGRLLHVLPAKRNAALAAAEAAGEESGHGVYKKQQQQARRQQAEQGSDTWNSLFFRSDTVAAATADQFGIKKGELLDRSADNVSVRMALSETHVIEETVKHLEEQGVNIDVLQRPVAAEVKRSNVVVLVKNLPYEADEVELRCRFGSFGELGRVILPPSHAVALVEYVHANDAKKAFRTLAYSKFHHVPLYLEWAPADILKPAAKKKPAEPVEQQPSTASSSATAADDDENFLPLDVDEPKPASAASPATATVHVKNLNFITGEEALRKHLETAAPVRSVVIVKTKVKGVTKSMGYGFAEFVSQEGAQRALRLLDGKVLDEHTLVMQPAASKKTDKSTAPSKTKQRRDADADAESLKPSAKLMVKNVAFEATRRELQQLFSAFGHIKALRLPRKFDGSNRGFAFVEYTTKQEAKTAKQRLAATHFYGRHLVLQYAKEDDLFDNM